MISKLIELFKVNKPIMGMIHCNGGEKVVDIALEEIKIYEDEGVDGIIVENYFGSVMDVQHVLEQVNTKMIVGLNVLPNDFDAAFNIGYNFSSSRNGFIQVDWLAGKYEKTQPLNEDLYRERRADYSSIFVMGGVWPKYYIPVKDSDLATDIKEAETRVDAIVVTGSGTGHETPIKKIKQFRELTSFPLIVGAGLTADNAFEQLSISDGAIVGTYFKRQGHTHELVSRDNVRDLMKEVFKVRKYFAN